MDDDTTPDGSGIIGDNTKDGSSEEGAHGFPKGLTEMYGDIKDSNGQNGFWSGQLEECQNHKTPKKQLNYIKVEDVKRFVNADKRSMLGIEKLNGRHDISPGVFFEKCWTLAGNYNDRYHK